MRIMMLEEANSRLKKEKITEKQLWDINSLYLLLDLDKDDFCKIVDAVGVEKLIEKKNYYENIRQAEEEMRARENYKRNKYRLYQLEAEKQLLENSIKEYEENQ